MEVRPKKAAMGTCSERVMERFPYLRTSTHFKKRRSEKEKEVLKLNHRRNISQYEFKIEILNKLCKQILGL
jgi:hypothetical protein